MGFAWLYLKQNKPHRAWELVGLVQHHPAYNDDVQIVLDELLPHMEEALGAAERQAALERGQKLDIDAVAQEILAASQVD